MRKCLECKKELSTSEEIIFHTCSAYPQKEEVTWLDVLISNSEKEEMK